MAYARHHLQDRRVRRLVVACHVPDRLSPRFATGMAPPVASDGTTRGGSCSVGRAAATGRAYGLPGGVRDRGERDPAAVAGGPFAAGGDPPADGPDGCCRGRTPPAHSRAQDSSSEAGEPATATGARPRARR